MSQTLENYSLHRQNLVPFYLVEDKIRQNFTKIEKFIANQIINNENINSKIDAINHYNLQFKGQMDRRFVQMQKKIVSQIGSELQGRIVVAINKNMAGFAGRMEQKQKQIAQISQGINEKLENIKKVIVNEVTRDNQKTLTKQIEKLQKKTKANLEQITKKLNSTPKINQSNARPHSREHEQVTSSKNYYNQNTAQNQFSQQWALKIKDLQAKTLRQEQFMVGFDKRFYENMSALKGSWKELGEDIIQTKRRLTTKQDELKLELVKLKGMKQFQGSPDDLQETFKKKLMSKFTDIYQLIAQLTTRTDLESETDRIRKTLNRHDGELTDLRQQMARNNDYFTFYVNNSSSEDLSAQIKALQIELQQRDALSTERLKNQVDKNEEILKNINQITQNLQIQSQRNSKSVSEVSRLREQLFQQIQRIDALQQHNNFTPQKLAKIHNTLDIDFSPSEQELINKKKSDQTQSLMMKEIRMEVGRLKDQIFVLSHQSGELQKVKKSVNGLEGKIDKLKVQSQEAILSRKPWVCLSCDKNQREKQEGEKLRKQVSRKKLVDSKAMLFSKQKSDKLIKLIPTTEEKFQVYERYREKYLSDSVKLPEIYKEKIGDKSLLL